MGAVDARKASKRTSMGSWKFSPLHGIEIWFKRQRTTVLSLHNLLKPSIQFAHRPDPSQISRIGSPFYPLSSPRKEQSGRSPPKSTDGNTWICLDAATRRLRALWEGISTQLNLDHYTRWYGFQNDGSGTYHAFSRITRARPVAGRAYCDTPRVSP
ncbi:hypothetical protein N656DRAFT_384904 [Canariomyces notabilis]|uniref:Uncharacterized protein n=1 Tax=Canariomyces notabilis TaxID=2074819 RepID=A0AAN6TJC8_9PEZI|nr:hypothetical protein N656DRAFT_384904 [Canariomyces arenarius]